MVFQVEKARRRLRVQLRSDGRLQLFSPIAQDFDQGSGLYATNRPSHGVLAKTVGATLQS